MLRKNWDDLDTNGQKGDWCFLNDDTTIVLRFGDQASDVCVRDIAPRWNEVVKLSENVHYWSRRDKPYMEWNGSKDAPTLTPAIVVLGGEDRPARWQGYLRDGKLITIRNVLDLGRQNER